MSSRNSSIRIAVIRATNLDGFTSSSTHPARVHVVLKLSGETYKTREASDDKNPIWGETFEFLVSDPDSPDLKLQVNVVRHHRITPDINLGTISIPLTDMMSSQANTFNLQNCAGGSITLMRFYEKDPIKHVVLLCLENRSFDQMLGGLNQDIPIDGASSTNYNLDKNGRRVYQQKKNYEYNKADVNHNHKGVMDQIKGDNKGFITACQDYDDEFKLESYEGRHEEIMSYFPNGSLPALHQLAKNYTVCDKWFASVPGETWPNSQGHTRMPDEHADFELYFERQHTIFDRLTEKGKSWKVYSGDMPLSLLLANQWIHPDHLLRYHGLDQFFEDVDKEEDADKFPEFSFIEPAYIGAANDDHAPHHIQNGQNLIARVYNAIRKNKQLWSSTLLVILYDEHGGFYDHVPPPSTVAPDDHIKKDADFSFDRLGVRVPAILVSPYFEKCVDHTIYDHTSLLAYLRKKWNLGELGRRTEQANEFSHNLLSEIRTDCLDSIEVPPHDAKTRSGEGKTKNGLQQDTLSLMSKLSGHLVKTQKLNHMEVLKKSEDLASMEDFCSVINKIIFEKKNTKN